MDKEGPQVDWNGIVGECSRLIRGGERLLEGPMDPPSFASWQGEVRSFLEGMASGAMEREYEGILPEGGTEGREKESVIALKGLLEAVRQDHLALDFESLKEGAEELRRLLKERRGGNQDGDGLP